MFVLAERRGLRIYRYPFEKALAGIEVEYWSTDARALALIIMGWGVASEDVHLSENMKFAGWFGFSHHDNAMKLWKRVEEMVWG
tara:strand:- start:82 stop:333 length:252 start_codon:yes stop_codon:yes gene_type:complete